MPITPARLSRTRSQNGRYLLLSLLVTLSFSLLLTGSATAAPPHQQTGPTTTPNLSFNQSTFAGRTAESTTDIALGDIDGDGDLDLAIADEYIGPQLYLNDNGTFQTDPVWPTEEISTSSAAVAWGDIDGDGDLDLAVGNNKDTCDLAGCSASNLIYRNVNGMLESTPIWESDETADTTALIWGDLNNDGWLDLIVGNRGEPLCDSSDTDCDTDAFLGEANHIYFNQADGTLPTTADWTSTEADETTSLAVGDMDDDGDLDLAVGNINASNRIHTNENGALDETADWDDATNEDNFTKAVAWGDLDRDGLLELAVASYGDPYNRPRVYYNNTGTPDATDYWEPNTDNAFTSLAWADFNGDGYLDLALGTQEDDTNRIYLNSGDTGTLTESPGWQSADIDLTETLAVGDLNNDGTPDLVAGNYDQRNRLYLNNGFMISPEIYWETPLNDGTAVNQIAWGDADNDGDLDLAAANGTNLIVYRNDGLDAAGTPQLTPGAPLPNTDQADWQVLTWGDYDNDGWLDLAAAGSVDVDTTTAVFRNQRGSATPTFTPGWTAVLTNSLASTIQFGDFNNDTNLDLLVATTPEGLENFCLGENTSSSAIFLQTPTATSPFATAPDWQFATPADSDCFLGARTAAAGDIDNDGDLDLIFAGDDATRLLRNDSGGTLTFTTIWSLPSPIFVPRSIALGDIDGDGDLDLAVGTERANAIYTNENGRFSAQPAWSSPDSEDTTTIALGDMDGDGDLDMAAANEFVSPVIYRNTGTMLSSSIQDRWQGPEQIETVAWADIDNDGDLDLTATEINTPILAYRNTSHDTPGLTNTPPALSLQNPVGGFGMLGVGYGYGRFLTNNQIPINYTLTDAESDTVARVAGYFSTNGGGLWQPAIPTSDTPTTNLNAAFDGTAHTYTWDTFASGLFGQSRNTIFMLIAYENAAATHTNITGTVTYPATTGSSGRAPTVAATTTPFAIQGTQVRVQDQNGSPIPNAHIYRIPAGQAFNGELMPSSANPLTTNEQGLLPGSSVVNLGDNLMAMVPYTPTTAENELTFTDQGQYYLTSARPNDISLDMTPLQNPGILNLTIPTDTSSSDYNPLLLYDLTISTEWDATGEPLFMQQLADGIQQASALLYDVTNGQMALGRVYVYPSKAYWDSADVIVYANNSLRPSASIGGITQRPLPETVLTADGGTKTIPDAYLRGQIRMGTVWNPFGEQSAELSEDWWQALAHELSHYLLFLPDNYLGFVDGTFSRVNCQGSFMTSTYDPDYSEFLITPEWEDDPDCLNTLANATTGRTDWETITTFYPLLKAPTAAEAPFTGPVILPINTTTVWPTTFANGRTPIPARTFDVRDALNQRVRLPNAQVYLFQTQATADPSDDIVLLLGSPTAGGDRIKVRGAYPGDRLCLFDNTAGSRYAGCIDNLSASDVALRVSAAPSNWQPEISVQAITSRTLQVDVNQIVPSNSNLNVQVIPAHYGSTPCLSGLSPTTAMTRSGNNHSATLTMLAPAYDVAVRVWLGSSPVRETVTSALVNWPTTPTTDPDTPTPPSPPDCEFPDYTLGDLVYTAVVNPVGGPSTNPVGGPSTNPVGGPSTNPVGGPSTNPVGGPSTNPIGGPSTNPIGGANVNLLAGPSTNPVGGPSTNPVGGPSTNPVGGPSTNPIGGPSTNPVGGPSTNPVGGAQSRILSAPFWSTDAQVVIYNETGFFEDNGVAGLQRLSHVPGLDPWLLLVGQAHHVTPDTAVTDPRSISFSYLQRNVPDGYEHTLGIYFRADSATIWQPLPTRRFVENLVVAELQTEPGIYAVMASIALPPLQAGWNLMAYPLPDSRPVAIALASLGDRVTAVLPYDPTAANPFTPPADTAQTPAGLELEFGRIYWVRLAPGDAATPYLVPPRLGPDGNFLRLE